MDDLTFRSAAATDVQGTADDDVLYADKSGSRLTGASGTDILVAGPGSDTLTGGSGFDSFVFQKPTTDAANQAIGGYGGNDVITDFRAVAGAGDVLKLRNLDNDTGISVSTSPEGNAVVRIDNRYSINPTAGASRTGDFESREIQTITLLGVTGNQLMTQGLLEVNGALLNETSQGVAKAFGTYDYIVGAIAATFPLRSGGSSGNTVFGDARFGTPGVAPENNLVAGDFVAKDKIASVLDRIVSVVTEITIPGTDANIDDPATRANLEAQHIIGTIPESLLPRNAFSFAIGSDGRVDLNKFTPTFDPSTVNDDVIIGGPGNDILVGGPGNDVIVGNAGTDIIWAGTGQDIIVGREGVDYIIFDSILEIRDRDNVAQDPISNALPDARIGYIRYEEPYGIPLEDPFTTKTGPDVILVNSQAFNRGIDPHTNPELAAQIGYLKPGTIISAGNTGTALTKNGQLNTAVGTVPRSDGPAEDDLQPLFYYSSSAARLFFDRDGAGAQFGDFWMADMGTGSLPSVDPGFAGIPAETPAVLIYIY